MDKCYHFRSELDEEETKVLEEITKYIHSVGKQSVETTAYLQALGVSKGLNVAKFHEQVQQELDAEVQKKKDGTLSPNSYLIISCLIMSCIVCDMLHEILVFSLLVFLYFAEWKHRKEWHTWSRSLCGTSRFKWRQFWWLFLRSRFNTVEHWHWRLSGDWGHWARYHSVLCQLTRRPGCCCHVSRLFE